MSSNASSTAGAGVSRDDASTAVVMTDVARAAGVSPKTVSRVVNGSPQVRPEVRDRVQRVIQELGYRPNAAARALATNRTHVLGVVGLGSSAYGVAQHVMGVERAARTAGYGVVVVSTQSGGVEEVVAAARRAGELGAEGVVLVEPFFDASDHVDAFGSMPVVTAMRARSEFDRRVLTVQVDQVEGVRSVVEHLVGLGHTKIAHLAGPVDWESGHIRELTWRAEMALRSLDVVEPARGDWSARSGYEAMADLLGRYVPTAVFAANDHMAIGAMRALAEAGLSVPGDVALVGFDDVPEAEFLPVPLTTVRQDFDEMALRAVDGLVRLIEGPLEAPPLETLPVHLIVRASSGSPRAPEQARTPTTP